MPKLTGTFATRRDADMTVERLVQEFRLDRAAISIVAAGEANSVGEDRDGSDLAAGKADQDDRDDAPLNGAIVVTADVADEDAADKVRAACAEFEAERVSGTPG